MIEICDWLMRRKMLVGVFLALFWGSGLLGYKIISVCAQDAVEVPTLGEVEMEKVEEIEEAREVERTEVEEAREVETREATRVEKLKDASKSALGDASGGRNQESENIAENFQPRPAVEQGRAETGDAADEMVIAGRLKAKLWAAGVFVISAGLLVAKYMTVRFWRR